MHALETRLLAASNCVLRNAPRARAPANHQIPCGHHDFAPPSTFTRMHPTCATRTVPHACHAKAPQHTSSETLFPQVPRAQPAHLRKGFNGRAMINFSVYYMSIQFCSYISADRVQSGGWRLRRMRECQAFATSAH